jgi:hypothetical protein
MWFSKKREEENANDYREELEHLNTNLKQSFQKIKEDIKNIKAWIEYFEGQHKDHKSKFKNVESKLTQMDEFIAYSVLAPQKNEKNKQDSIVQEEIKEILEEAPKPHYLKVLEDLTETQKTMFYRLALLLKEADQEWVTMKTLATDLYPDKEYDRVRSTASEYVNILIESGLLEKRRRGKQTYIAITNKGKQLLEKSKHEITQKVKNRAKK